MSRLAPHKSYYLHLRLQRTFAWKPNHLSSFSFTTSTRQKEIAPENAARDLHLYFDKRHDTNMRERKHIWQNKQHELIFNAQSLTELQSIMDKCFKQQLFNENIVSCIRKCVDLEKTIINIQSNKSDSIDEITKYIIFLYDYSIMKHILSHSIINVILYALSNTQHLCKHLIVGLKLKNTKHKYNKIKEIEKISRRDLNEVIYESCMHLFNEMINKYKIEPHEQIYTTLISMCTRFGMYDRGIDIWNKALEQETENNTAVLSVFNWNAIIDLYIKKNDFNKAFELYTTMACSGSSSGSGSGMIANHVTFGTILYGLGDRLEKCTKIRRETDVRKDILGIGNKRIIQHVLKLTLEVVNHGIQYAKLRQNVQDSDSNLNENNFGLHEYDIKRKMTNHNETFELPLKAVINAYGIIGDIQMACDILRLMLNPSAVLNSVNENTNENKKEMANEFVNTLIAHQKIAQADIKAETKTEETAMTDNANDANINDSIVDDIFEIKDSIPRPCVISFNNVLKSIVRFYFLKNNKAHVISGFMSAKLISPKNKQFVKDKNGSGDACINEIIEWILNEMKNENIEPTFVTYGLIFGILRHQKCSSQQVKRCMKYYNEMKQKRLDAINNMNSDGSGGMYYATDATFHNFTTVLKNYLHWNSREISDKKRRELYDWVNNELRNVWNITPDDLLRQNLTQMLTGKSRRLT